MKRGNGMFAPLNRNASVYGRRPRVTEGFNPVKQKPLDQLECQVLGTVGVFWCSVCIKMVIIDITQPKEDEVCVHCNAKLTTEIFTDPNIPSS